MKLLGVVLITLGIALLLYMGYSYIRGKNKIASPIPEDRSVKVILVTPTR